MSLRQRLKKWTVLLENKKNFKQGPKEKKDIINASLRRQSKTASLILRAYISHRPGVILADDVGLGKTWVGILVALAFASRGGKVIISSPNVTIRNKWAVELAKWYDNFPNPNLYNLVNEIKWGNYKLDKKKLQDNLIMLLTHYQFKERTTPWNCDLLIVDEAHKGKDKTSFLKKDNSDFRLFLTATPFGKNIDDLSIMLKAVGCKDEDVYENIRYFKDKQLSYSKTQETTIEDLMASLKKCQKCLQPWLIRHDLDNLPAKEKKSIGRPVHILGNFVPSQEIKKKFDKQFEKPIKADKYTAKMLLHAQRLKQIKINIDQKERYIFDFIKDTQYLHSSTLMAPISTTSLQDICDQLRNSPEINLINNSRVNYHLEELKKCLVKTKRPKQKALKTFAKECFRQNEKFIVFCYHHKTADEARDIILEAWNECGIQTLEIDKILIEKLLSGNKHHDRVIGKLPPFQYSKNIVPGNNEIKNLLFELATHKNALTRIEDDKEVSMPIRFIPDTVGGKESVIRILFNSPFHPQALVLTSEHSEGYGAQQN